MKRTFVRRDVSGTVCASHEPVPHGHICRDVNKANKQDLSFSACVCVCVLCVCSLSYTQTFDLLLLEKLQTVRQKKELRDGEGERSSN